MAVRITSISLGMALILLAVSPAVSIATYGGPGPFPQGGYYGGPALAGPRPMYGGPGCAPACPPPCPPPCAPVKCAPPCPPAYGPCPPPCPPPCEQQRECFNPLSCIFNLICAPFRLFGGGGQGCDMPPCPPPSCMPMAPPSCMPACPPPVAKCKPPKGYRPMMQY